MRKPLTRRRIEASNNIQKSTNGHGATPGMDMKSKIISLIALGLFGGSALAGQPNILGTWQGSLLDTDASGAYFGQGNTLKFDVTSESGTSISGNWDWLSGSWAGCTTYPCETTWSGTINALGMISIVGQYGDDYYAQVVGNQLLLGTFSGPAGAPDYGVWSAIKLAAPEFDSTSTSTALTLLLGGLIVFSGRRMERAAS